MARHPWNVVYRRMVAQGRIVHPGDHPTPYDVLHVFDDVAFTVVDGELVINGWPTLDDIAEFVHCETIADLQALVEKEGKVFLSRLRS